MSLLPKALQFRDDALSLPLGPARVKPVEEKADRISEFNKGDHCGLWVTEYDYEMIQEEDCRQIKGAAQATHTAPAIPAKPVAAPPKFKVGDRVRVVGSDLTGCEGPVVAIFPESSFPVRVFIDEISPSALFEYSELEPIPSEPQADEGLVDGKIYLARFPSGKEWFCLCRDGALHGSTGPESLSLLVGKGALLLRNYDAEAIREATREELVRAGVIK